MTIYARIIPWYDQYFKNSLFYKNKSYPNSYYLGIDPFSAQRFSTQFAFPIDINPR